MLVHGESIEALYLLCGSCAHLKEWQSLHEALESMFVYARYVLIRLLLAIGAY
jgi:hypothetical protein